MHCLEKYYLCKYKTITKERLSKLEESNIITVTDLLLKTPETIMTITDMTHSDYEKLTNEIFSKCRPECGSLLGRLQDRGEMISTGIAKLDSMLGGGIYGGEILELFGLPSTGKTQMCLTVAALASQGKQDLSVLYLDLKNDFNPVRFNELCQACDEKIARIRIYRESKVKDVINILEDFENKLCAANTVLGGSLRVIIIDSLPIMFYPCETEYDDSARICQERVFQTIKRIAFRFGVAIFTTNHAVSQDFFRKPKTTTRVSGQQKQRVKPALGIYWNDVPNFRLHLAIMGEYNEFSATLCKSTRTEEKQTFLFKILDAGIG